MAGQRKKRRLAIINDKGRGVVIKEPIPPVKPGQVLLRVRAAAISPGTELNNARELRKGTYVEQGFQQKIGYQNSGEVIEVGRGVKQFRKGDRVASFGGGYSYITDYAVVPQNLCCKMPDKVSFVDASYGNVMLTGLQAVRRAEPVFGEYALIVGLGIVGQFAAQFARYAGLRVMGSDMYPLRNRIARQCGIHAAINVKTKDLISEAKGFTNGHGFDAAVLAIGGDGSEALKSVIQAMQHTVDGHEMGRIVLVGGMTAQIRGGTGFGNADLCSSARTGAGYHDDKWEHGKRDYPPVFMRWNTRSNYDLALNLIATGEINVKPLTTHKLPIAKIDQAVSAHLEDPRNTLGTVLTME